MAKFSRGILGGFQGKVGTVVGFRWRNLNLMRAVAEHVRDARSPKQLAQREKFRMVTALMQPFRPLVEAGFQVSNASNYNGANAALSYNMRYGLVGEYPNLEVDYPAIRVAMGSLQGAENPGVVTQPGVLELTWNDNSGVANAQESDTAIVVAYSEELGQAVYTTSGNTREEEFTPLAIPEDLIGGPLHVWLAFVSGSRGISSNSQYLGEHTAV